MKKIILMATFFIVSCLVSTTKAESIIYIFDNYPYAQMQSVTFNGEDINLSEKPFKKVKLGLTEYKKGVTRCVIKNEGQVIITRDLIWADKPYHDEITLDVTDGENYYIELVSGPSSKIKLLKEKDGVKKFAKAEKDTDSWVINEDFVYEN